MLGDRAQGDSEAQRRVLRDAPGRETPRAVALVARDHDFALLPELHAYPRNRDA